MKTIDEIRRENLRTAISEFPSARQLALKMGTNPNNISRVFSDNPKNRRNVGDDLARSVEKAAEKPRGWMDIDHESSGDYVGESILTYTPDALDKLDYDSLVAWIIETIPDLPVQHRLSIAQAALADLPKDALPSK